MKTLKKVLWTSAATMALTAFHHAYGAIIYDAPFRKYVAVFAILIILISWITYKTFLKHQSSLSAKFALWIFIIITALIPIGIIGLVEGGYNHLAKNILFFAGTSQATFNQLFPPPTYEIPTNILFETTGILQFFAGLIVLNYLLRYWKITKQASVNKQKER